MLGTCVSMTDLLVTDGILLADEAIRQIDIYDSLFIDTALLCLAQHEKIILFLPQISPSIYPPAHPVESFVSTCSQSRAITPPHVLHVEELWLYSERPLNNLGPNPISKWRLNFSKMNE